MFHIVESLVHNKAQAQAPFFGGLLSCVLPYWDLAYLV